MGVVLLRGRRLLRICRGGVWVVVVVCVSLAKASKIMLHLYCLNATPA